LYKTGAPAARGEEARIMRVVVGRVALMMEYMRCNRPCDVSKKPILSLGLVVQDVDEL
jgi:hypothetical protein